MIPCKHCNTLNSLDSTFCKRCGTGLPEEQLAEAKAELEKVVEEGFKALELNHLEEASAIAESATSSDPSSTQALSLKASCHERRGQIAEALECAERIVELNPNSELDKIKRNQLRSALAAGAVYRAQPGKWVAVLAGVSAAVIVMCIGLIIWRQTDAARASDRLAANSPSTLGATNLIGPGHLDSGGAVDPNSVTPQTGQNPPATQNQVQPSNNGDQPRTTPETAQTQDNSAPSRPDFPRVGSQTLPSVDGSGDTFDMRPVQPSGPPSTNSTTPTKPAPKTDTSGDPAPTPEGPAAQAQGVQTPVDPGEIHISVHQNGPQRIGASGSQPVTSPSAGSVQMYSRLGQEQFQIGNYPGAASAFEQALKSGGDPIVLNHLLGRAYQNQGRNSDALAAFQHAIDASRSALNSGRGNTAKIQAIKDACETAVSQLRGG